MIQLKPFSCFLLVAMMMVTMTSAYDVGSMKRYLDKRWQLMARRANCVNSAGKCYTTAECCEDLVCAAVDDFLGQQPEAPGYCVKEKELDTCVTTSDCSMGSRCMTLGRTGESYCVPSPGPQAFQRKQLQEVEAASGEGGSKGLGDGCVSSSDCKSTSEYSNTKLCCQDVHRGRQGVKRVCDRVTTISICV